MTTIQDKNQDASILAYEILNDLYQCIDDTFVSYFISLTAPRTWRPHLEKYEFDYRKILQEEGYTTSEIEGRITEQNHVFSEEEFRVQTTTRNLRKILTPGNFENIQAKNAIKIVYDSWESSYSSTLYNFMTSSLTLVRHEIAQEKPSSTGLFAA